MSTVGQAQGLVLKRDRSEVNLQLVRNHMFPTADLVVVHIHRKNRNLDQDQDQAQYQHPLNRIILLDHLEAARILRRDILMRQTIGINEIAKNFDILQEASHQEAFQRAGVVVPER